MPSILFRTDSSLHMGTGHVMRCLSLAQAWENAHPGGSITFLCKGVSGLLQQRIEESGAIFIPMADSVSEAGDAERTREVLRETSAGWLVLDNYHYTPDYQQAVKRGGHSTLLIDDDVRWPRYHADILLNQNFGAEHFYYPRDPQTHYLLGSTYTLLRPDFESYRTPDRTIAPHARRILVSMGGSDPENTALQVVQALQQSRQADIQVRVVSGPSFPYLTQLQDAIASAGPTYELLTSTTAMPELMAWADLAVLIAGGTMWESLCLGCPTLSFARTAFQEKILQALQEAGALMYQGLFSSFDSGQFAQIFQGLAKDPARRQQLSRKGQAMIDGQGSTRVIQMMARMSQPQVPLRREAV
jgi:UDP-2,4-diacetamido-2,4,6-trideoxy-beta-L-altropyranose hydrolase